MFYLITRSIKFSYTTTSIENIIYEISSLKSSKIHKSTHEFKKLRYLYYIIDTKIHIEVYI